MSETTFKEIDTLIDKHYRGQLPYKQSKNLLNKLANFYAIMRPYDVQNNQIIL